MNDTALSVMRTSRYIYKGTYVSTWNNPQAVLLIDESRSPVPCSGLNGAFFPTSPNVFPMRIA